MGYIEGQARGQLEMMPRCLEDYVSEENPVRLIDGFIQTLDIEACGFKRGKPAQEGRPGYDPRMLLGLYVYGYNNRIRSSRRLAKETERNVEVMWLCNRLTPDFRTIADYRKDNVDAMYTVFRKWNEVCTTLGLFGKEYVSIDGSKFKANNSKDRNFTLTKLDERLKRIEEHIKEYMGALEKADAREEDERKLSREEIGRKLVELRERKEQYEGYLEQMEETGATQISLTDPEAKLMKFKEGYEVGYNIQTAVDSKEHMIAGFKVSDHPADNGLIECVAQEVKQSYGVDILETVEDKGYHDKEDMVRCLESGIIPHVHPARDFETFTLTTEYEGGDIGQEQKGSTKAEDIKACLRAGVIPQVYSGVIREIEIGQEKVYEQKPRVDETYKTVQEMQEKAKSGYFVRDLVRDRVYCPAGEILRYKAHHRGECRYSNKLACERCMQKCCGDKFKVVSFREGATQVGCRAYGNETNRRAEYRKATIKKVVRIKFKPDERKLDTRKNLSEHPFGSVKHWDQAGYFLLRGMRKVRGELSLSYLAYNMKRALKVCGLRKIVAAFT